MEFDIAMLRDWVGTLCRLDADAETVLAALGLTGPAGVHPGRDSWAWPWPNVRHARVGRSDGTVTSVFLELRESRITHADLSALGPDGRFTAGHPPHIPLDWQAFEVAGEPFRCTVSAGFEPVPPTFSAALAAGPRTAVELRIERHRSYRPGVPRPGLAGMVGQLGRWSERLCVIPSEDASEVAAALGIEGTVGADGDVDPAPPGMRRLNLLSRWEGSTFDVEVTLLDSTITAADLQARFGPGRPGVRIHPFSEFTLHYERVTGPDPTVTCSVHASFADEPVPAAVTGRVHLSRYRSRS